MKTKHLFLITFLLIAAILSNSFAQDNAKVGLLEGAIARLGKGGIVTMRFSPDGPRLAVGTEIGVWLYDVNTGAGTILLSTELRHANNRAFGPSRPAEWQPAPVTFVNHLAFSPDNSTLAVGYVNNHIRLWDLKTEQERNTLLPPSRRYGLRY